MKLLLTQILFVAGALGLAIGDISRHDPQEPEYPTCSFTSDDSSEEAYRKRWYTASIPSALRRRITLKTGELLSSSPRKETMHFPPNFQGPLYITAKAIYKDVSPPGRYQYADGCRSLQIQNCAVNKNVERLWLKGKDCNDGLRHAIVGQPGCAPNLEVFHCVEFRAQPKA
ncbi:hypothetical protein K440DRAFT_643971 [Wilcoxina mikolae CBS 423.85]|nr:hypothetical protein K440DRAFT_643971 [Wilcoxina mikolae CBS 423.85]